MPAVRVLLVRHGESTWNAEGRWQGQADAPLSDRGREQAAIAAEALPAVDLLVASDLDRARETAELIAAGRDLAVEVEPRFRERDAGTFSGLTRAEIHAHHPGHLPDDPTRDPSDGRGLVPPPGWEPDESLVARAWAALGDLAARLAGTAGRTAVVITHSGLVYAVERDLGAPRSRIANLEGRWLRREPSGWVLGERQLLLDPTRTAVTSPDQL